jgi:hypothetical protein
LADGLEEVRAGVIASGAAVEFVEAEVIDAVADEAARAGG